MSRIAVFVLSALCAAAVSWTAFAQGRPDTRAMSCHEVQSLIEARGAVVLTTGQHTYDRYVSPHGFFCEWPYEPKRTTVQAGDTRQCSVYHCRDVQPFLLFDRD